MVHLADGQKIYISIGQQVVTVEEGTLVVTFANKVAFISRHDDRNVVPGDIHFAILNLKLVSIGIRHKRFWRNLQTL